MESIYELFAVAAFLAVAGLFLWVLVGSVQSLIFKKNTPTLTVAAKLTKKSCETGLGEFGKDGLRLGKTVRTLSFTTQNGDELSFFVSEPEWNAVSEQTSGHLTYRGKEYLGFAPDGLMEDSENV